jgi:hypothetical protein
MNSKRRSGNWVVGGGRVVAMRTNRLRAFALANGDLNALLIRAEPGPVVNDSGNGGNDLENREALEHEVKRENYQDKPGRPYATPRPGTLRPRPERLAALMDGYGGPLLYDDSGDQQRSFDSTCRKLRRFLNDAAR